jgi:hypothetical protein
MNIVERIKKLLRLSKSPYPGEAEAAMAKALDLAARHQVDLDALDLNSEERRIMHRAMRVGRRISYERRMALGIVKCHFNVSPVIRYPDVLLVGESDAVAIAEYVVEFLVRSSRRDACRMRRLVRRYTSRRRRSFLAGWFYGVSSTLKSAHAQTLTPGTGLVLQRAEQRRAVYIADTIGRTEITRGRDESKHDSEFVRVGFDRGRSTQIRPGVAAAPAAMQLGGSNKSSTGPETRQ